MLRRIAPFAIAIGLLFLAGLAVDRLIAPPTAAPAPSSGRSAPAGSGDVGVVVVEPRVAIDPSKVQLLPDASLQLELPSGFDAGPDAPGGD